MKRTTLCALLAGVMVFGSGCKKKEEVIIEEVPNENAVVTPEERLEVERRAYELHNRLLPKVETAFKESGYDYKGVEEVNNDYYSGYNGLLYKNDSKIEVGNVYEAKYSIGTDVDGINGVYVDLYMHIDENDVKTNGIKLEDTFFAKMDKAITDEDYNFEEFDLAVKKSCETGNDLTETKVNGNIHRTLYRNGNTLTYTVYVYPEN